MIQNKLFRFSATAALASTAFAFVYADNSPSYQELQSRLDSLENRLDDTESNLKINGFFSASFATHDDDMAVTDSWGGLSDKNDFRSLSNLGIQMTYTINDYMTMVTQLAARGHEDWDVEAEWAFVAYEVSDALTLRFGRQKAPLYLLSEYIEVGYAMPWITAPDEVYGITGDSTYDGIGALYTFSIGDWDTTLQALLANNSFFSANVGGTVDLNDFVTVSLTGEYDSWTLRAGYSLVSGDIPALAGGAVPANPETDISYVSLGAKYDDGEWLVMSEMVELSIDGAMADVKSSYLMVGYRFGDLMPHFTWSKMQNNDAGDRDFAGPVVGPMLDAALVEEQTTYTVGVRWDLMPGTAAKFEVSHITDFEGTKGQFVATAQPSHSSLDIIKFSLDSVF
ncbi:MAG: hypothetical protein P1U80_00680 [Pseudomonadales bacterium]|nr:hypothetical protein [Pseudomonadales bacterium]